MKLNLGSNTKIFHGWVNVDVDDIVSWVQKHVPDGVERVKEEFVQADLRDFLRTVPDDTCEAIAMIHVLDHFTYEDAHRILKDCHRCLAPEGILRIAVEDLEDILEIYRKNSLMRFAGQQPQIYGSVCEDARLAMLVFGSLSERRDRYTGHKMIYSEESLSELLSGSGFSGCQAWMRMATGESNIEDWQPEYDTNPGHTLIVEVQK